VDRLLREPAVLEMLAAAPRTAVVRAVRDTLDAARSRRDGTVRLGNSSMIVS